MGRSFPSDFLWGASIAAHQVEGGTHNQWSEWEQANARRLAATAEQRLSRVFPHWTAVAAQAADPATYISAKAVDHYNRYEEDFDLLEQLHLNTFRFSIEWSRIEPREGEWDEQAIEHYRRYIAALKKRHIEPFPTLWHWTVPVWFAAKGGFAKRRNVRYFERFVQKVVGAYGSELHYLVTLNEPSAYVGQGYIAGQWPPQRRNPLLGVTVYCNLVAAHRRAYQLIKDSYPAISVGLSAHLINFKPLRPSNWLNRLTVRVMGYAANDWFLDRIRSTSDFVGVNYYFTAYTDWHGGVHDPAQPRSDLGWYMEPRAIGDVLMAVWRRYRKPIIVTENGLADGDDTHRQWWLEETIAAMQSALENGVDLRGYLHWSLVDNFEWAYGWLAKFGLVAVNCSTLERSIRPSAKWLAQYVQAHRE